MYDEVDNLMDQYYQRFGEGFPTYQLLRGRTPAESAEIIKQCLDAGKTAYELGLVTDDEDVEY